MLRKAFRVRVSRPAQIVFVAGLTSALPLQSSAQSVRDSMGIRIIDNQSPVLAGARSWRLSEQPILDIGPVGGEAAYEFSSIMGITRLSNGQYVVADMGSGQLRWFDAAGKFVRSAGRTGQGPGEFTQLMAVFSIRGDSLFAENGNDGVDLFTPDGRYLDRVRPNLGGSGTGRVPVSIVGAMDNGLLLAGPWTSLSKRAPRGEMGVDSTTRLLLRRDGTHVSTIGPVPNSVYGTAATQTMRVAFSPRARFGTDGALVHAAFGSSYEVQSYNTAGRLARIVRRSWTPKPISDAELTAWKEHYAVPERAEPNGEPLDRLRQLRVNNLQQMLISRTLPAYTDFIVDRTRGMWLRDARVSDFYVGSHLINNSNEPAVYSAFDSTGRWISNVTVPPGVRVMEIGADYMAGVKRDRDDVEHVVVYRLIKN